MKVTWDDTAKQGEKMTAIPEEGEPCLRSCPECNSAHKHLLKTMFLHCCFDCGRYWIGGKFLDQIKTEKGLYKHLKKFASNK